MLDEPSNFLASYPTLTPYLASNTYVHNIIGFGCDALVGTVFTGAGPNVGADLPRSSISE
jgi:hypothetical protein